VNVVDAFVMIHPGRSLSSGDDPVLRNEGAGIAMNSVMAAAWRNSGKCWKARIVYVQVKFQCSKCCRG